MKLALLIAPFALLFAQNPDVPVENEFVRVVKAIDLPGKAGAMHEHKTNRVMIYITPGDMRIAFADGRVDNQHWKAGDVAWSAAGGMHTSQNVSSGAVKIVELELKNKGTSATGARSDALIDNAQVRVTRTSSAPKSGNYVAVDVKTGEALWNKMPSSAGLFVVAEIR